MRFTDDNDLSFCLTVSTGIKRDKLLSILGMVEHLPNPQTFDDFAHETHQPGKKGLLNVFEVGDHLVTIENNGFLGVAHRTIKKVASLHGVVHYVTFYQTDGGAAGFQFAEVMGGVVLANFDPQFDEIPGFLLGPSGPGIGSAGDFSRNPRRSMIKAVEYQMMIDVQSQWLEQPTDTYVIDYRIDRD